MFVALAATEEVFENRGVTPPERLPILIPAPGFPSLFYSFACHAHAACRLKVNEVFSLCKIAIKTIPSSLSLFRLFPL